MGSTRSPLCLAVVVLAAVSAAAWAQYQVPVSPNVVAQPVWAGPGLATTHGAVFDGGLSVGATSGTGADTISANECQARLATYGYDTEQSSVISTMDRGGWKVAGFGLEWVALGALADGGYAEVSFNQTPLVYANYWRHFAGGADGGQPWFYGGSSSITNSGGPTSRAIGRISNSGSFGFNYGLVCFVPIHTGAGVDKVVQRINKEQIQVTVPH